MAALFLKESKKLNIRFSFLYVVITLIFGVLIVQLIKLQVVEGNENLSLSSIIKTSEVVVRAPRGLIFDRSGNLLVRNQPSFSLVIDLTKLPQEKEDQVLGVLSEILSIDREILRKDFMERVYGGEGNRTSLSQLTLLQNIDRDMIVSISSRIEELPGVNVEVSTTREYIDGSDLVHVIGYVREVSQREMENEEYTPGDLIGAVGIEAYYDEYLRGTNGRKILETDRDDTTVRELIPIEAIAGQSIKISIDLEMQRELTKALQAGIQRNSAGGGAAVLMDVTNGEILSLVSLPSYDPNKIVEGLSYSEAMQLEKDPNSPLSNRVISYTNPPGSTFKTIVASSALQEGLITPQTVFESTGCMELAEGYEFCEVGKNPLGKLDLYHGISRSSNIYFCNTMIRLGIGKLNEYTDDFGLGQKTGIDLVGEQKGIVASKEVKLSMEGEPWYLGDSCNAAIGQGLMRVSPIQMVAWASAIANGGKYYKPHLLVSTLDENGDESEVYEPELVRKLPVDDANLQIVREAMNLAVNDPLGSAFPLRGLETNPSAKTGSAEAFRKVNGKYEKTGHSWITGFFPSDDPKYAFAVYLEYGGWGFKSAEVMKDFLQWYETEY